ncbi:SURF1 family protein [Phenylobacterium immobile]|uniref:SURF1 family protein n=1 Tax=Phenylobacterium immobile TaxID=21 RepID=UPI000B0E61A5|nr:SURF1 family cytochrome oxidase biogenesis protein [Phenylobacterium immobile]
MTEPRRRPVALTIATVIAFAILVALGFWQVQRLAWKEALLARIAALQTVPAQPLASVLATGGDMDFVRVQATCPGLGAAPFLELYGLRDGQAGSRLISACATGVAAMPTILVDRGFVADTVSARPPVDPADRTPVAVTGVLRRPDKPSPFAAPDDIARGRWYARNTVAMAESLKAPAPAAPVFLFAETETNPGFAALTPAPIPAEIANRHLEYALTWFGLAAALVGVYAAVLFSRRKS